MEEEADIVIVGSGASGAAAAWSLSQKKGLRIICFEQGPQTKPDDYPSHFVDWELRRSSDYHVSPNVRRNFADYPIDDSASPISISNYNAFGGSTILYSGHFPRFHPSDFRTRTLDGSGDDWPISYRELKPYFDENERMMGVAGLVGDPANPPYESLLPPVPLGEMGKAVARGFNKLGWHWWPSYSAINTRRHLSRPSCINLGPCNTGCSQGAKASVDVTYWPLALYNGVKVISECQVQQVLLSNKGLAEGVLYVDRDGVSRRCRARIVMLACSGIGTPRLLLNSKSAAHPEGLLNDHGLVGKNLMLHPLGYVEGIFEEDLRSSIGPHGCCIFSQQFYETDFSRGFVRGYTMQVLRGAPPVETAITGYFMRQVPIGRDHHRRFKSIFNKTAGISVISEDLPEEHNRVELDENHKDSYGMPGVKVIYTLSENTKCMLKHGVEACKSALIAAGAKVSSSFAPVKNTGWHLMGTARMGDDPRRSVVNQFGQGHRVKNLFIVDSSIFVTAGAVNPVATAQALTLMICDHIKNHANQLM